jgi:hypothetical protein
VTKDEYIAFLENRNAQYYKEIQQLTYEKGLLKGKLMGIYERNPWLGMELIKGGKYYTLIPKGGAQ